MAFAKFFCELIIKVVHEQIKIPEVEYFDLELECLHRIMGKNQIFTRQVVRNLSITMIPLSATGVKRINVTPAATTRMLSVTWPWSLNAGNQDNHDDPNFCEKYKIFMLKLLL